MDHDAPNPPSRNAANAEEIARIIAAYHPRLTAAEWSGIAHLVKTTVADARPDTTSMAREFLMFMTRYTLWATRVAGYTADKFALDLGGVREYQHYLGLAKSPSTVRRQSAALLRIYRRLRHDHTVDPRISGPAQNHAEPYSPRELARLVSWASTLRLSKRRNNAWTILTLGIGCGLDIREIAATRTSDITDHGPDLGIELHVTTERGARTVWCLLEWEHDLRRILQGRRSSGGEFVYDGRSAAPQPRALMTFLHKARTDDGSAVSTKRLKITWIVHHLGAGTPLDVLLAASSTVKTSSFFPYYDHLPPLDASTTRRLLREGRSLR